MPPMNYTALILAIPSASMWFSLAFLLNSSCDELSPSILKDGCSASADWQAPLFLIIGFVILYVGVYFFMVYGRGLNNEQKTISEIGKP